MKKLISLLMVLLMVLTSAVALAETTGDSTVQPPEAGMELTDNGAPVTDDAATEGAENGESNPASQSLLTKGLIVTASGLLGVFLVLILFFLMIKIMGKMLK